MPSLSALLVGGGGGGGGGCVHVCVCALAFGPFGAIVLGFLVCVGVSVSGPFGGHGWLAGRRGGPLLPRPGGAVVAGSGVVLHRARPCHSPP